MADRNETTGMLALAGGIVGMIMGLLPCPLLSIIALPVSAVAVALGIRGTKTDQVVAAWIAIITGCIGVLASIAWLIVSAVVYMRHGGGFR